GEDRGRWPPCLVPGSCGLTAVPVIRTGWRDPPAAAHIMSSHELSLAIGSILQGGYEIVAELGSGSFGSVYRARQLSTGQQVAVKIPRTTNDAQSSNVPTTRAHTP